MHILNLKNPRGKNLQGRMLMQLTDGLQNAGEMKSQTQKSQNHAGAYAESKPRSDISSGRTNSKRTWLWVWGIKALFSSHGFDAPKCVTMLLLQLVLPAITTSRACALHAFHSGSVTTGSGSPAFCDPFGSCTSILPCKFSPWDQIYNAGEFYEMSDGNLLHLVCAPLSFFYRNVVFVLGEPQLCSHLLFFCFFR